MKPQKITKIVDALQTQGRAILWLACHHKISFTQVQLATLPSTYIGDLGRQGIVECPFCPDPPPEDVRQAKSVHQLWKEAGEP